MTETDQGEKFIETAFRSSDTNFRRLAQSFYDTVKDSRKFKWMGVSSVEDELGRSRLVIHLAERTREDYSIGKNPRPIPLTYVLTALQLADRSLIVDLYYLRESGNDTRFAEIALMSVQARYGKQNHDPKAEFLWEEYLSP